MRLRHWLSSTLAAIWQRISPFPPNRQIRRRLIGSICKSVALAAMLFSSGTSADESSFYPARKFATGYGPCDIDVADFDGDGICDVVTGNCYDGSVTVLLGNESGVLSEPIVTNNVFFGVSPRSELVAGDFTGDGFQDLVISRGGLNRLQLLSGSGDGTFDVVQEVTTQTEPQLSLKADFDNNGLPDILFINGFARQLAVALNLDGILSEPVPVATISSATRAVADDFNRDGFADLAVLSFSPSKIEILLGNGDGSFAPVSQLLPTENLRHLLSSDFDGDDIVDLISLHEESEFYKGNGDGTFQPGVGIESLTSPYYNFNNDAVASDFNADGFPDIATANDTEHDTYVFLNNGNASFQPRQAYAAGLVPEAIHAGDINNDGMADLLTTNIDVANLTSLLGNGDGTFEANLTTEFGSSSGNAQLKSDFNGDNRCDLVTFIENDDLVVVTLGLDDAMFSAPTLIAVGDRPVSIAINDFDGDGRMDVATANRNSDDVSVLFGNGDGSFQEEERIDVADGPNSIVTGEFTGDNIVDLATVNSSGSITVLPGNGNGSFGNPVPTKMIVGSRAKSGDLNGDGLTDIVVANNQDLHVLLAIGDGTFVPGENLSYPLMVAHYNVADVDGDTRPDLIASLAIQFDLELLVSFGNGDGTFADQQSFSTQQLNGGVQTFARSISVGNFNGDNIADIAAVVEYSGSSHYAWSGAVAILPGAGDREFRSFQLFDVNTTSRIMAVGDFNQDDADDLLVPVFDGLAQLFLNRQQFNPGDVNRDCAVNLLDIQPFVQVLESGLYQVEADVNQDGLVTLLDVVPFIDLLLD